MRKEVYDIMAITLNNISQITQYKNWSNDCKSEKLEEVLEEMSKVMKSKIDFNDITVEDAKLLRFRKWKGNLYLIPLYLLSALPDGLVVYSILGDKKIIGKDYIDNDIRFGCIAYGIKIGRDDEEEVMDEETIDLIKTLYNVAESIVNDLGMDNSIREEFIINIMSEYNYDKSISKEDIKKILNKI